MASAGLRPRASCQSVPCWARACQPLSLLPAAPSLSRFPGSCYFLVTFSVLLQSWPITTDTCGLGALSLSVFPLRSLPWHLTHSCGPQIDLYRLVDSQTLYLSHLLLDMSSKMLPGGLVGISDLVYSEPELLIWPPTCLPSSSPLQVTAPQPPRGAGTSNLTPHI